MRSGQKKHYVSVTMCSSFETNLNFICWSLGKYRIEMRMKQKPIPISHETVKNEMENKKNIILPKPNKQQMITPFKYKTTATTTTANPFLPCDFYQYAMIIFHVAVYHFLLCCFTLSSLIFYLGLCLQKKID